MTTAEKCVDALLEQVEKLERSAELTDTAYLQNIEAYLKDINALKAKCARLEREIASKNELLTVQAADRGWRKLQSYAEALARNEIAINAKLAEVKAREGER